MGILSKLLGVPSKKTLFEMMNNGAVLLDVRTKEEYNAGHVKKSICIPVSQISAKYSTLNKERPLIIVCESGARSAQVVRFVKNKGYKAYNGGSWSKFKYLDAD